MKWLNQPRRRVPPPDRHGSKSVDNPMFPKTQSALFGFRRTVLTATGSILGLLLLGLVIYGPWFEIVDVTVRGTEQIDASSIQRVTQAYLKKNRWLVLPNRNLWLLSRSDMADYIRSLIEKRIAIDAVKIEKSYPHGLLVFVEERIPMAVWQSGQIQASLDRRGVVVEFLVDRPTELPLVIDENQAGIAIGQPASLEGVMTAVMTLQEAFQEIQRPIEHFLIPLAVCPPVPPPDNTNININAVPQPANVNQVAVVANSNRSQTNTPTCDLEILRLNAPEVHVKLLEGPRLLFDRRQDLYQAVAVVQRLLQAPENRQAQYIDVRFGERVYIR